MKRPKCDCVDPDPRSCEELRALDRGIDPDELNADDECLCPCHDIDGTDPDEIGCEGDDEGEIG